MRGGGRQESGQEVRLHGLARPGPRGSGPTRTLGFPRGNVGLCLVRLSRKSCLAARLHHLTCPKDDMASVEWSRGRLGWRRLSVALGVRKGSSTGDRYVWPSVVDAVGRESHVVPLAGGLPTTPCSEADVTSGPLLSQV